MYALRSDSLYNDCTPGGETKDFKKVPTRTNSPAHLSPFFTPPPHKRVSVSPQLFEEVSRENSQLQSQLQDTQRVVSQTRLELEKTTQVTTQSVHLHEELDPAVLAASQNSLPVPVYVHQRKSHN